MFYILTTIIVIAAILLILVVLMQNSKKEGFGNAWSDAGANQFMGVQKTGDFLEHFTWALVATIFGLALVSSLFLYEIGPRSTSIQSPNIQRAKKHMPVPSAEQAVEEAHDDEASEEAPVTTDAVGEAEATTSEEE